MSNLQPDHTNRPTPNLQLYCKCHNPLPSTENPAICYYCTKLISTQPNNRPVCNCTCDWRSANSNKDLCYYCGGTRQPEPTVELGVKEHPNSAILWIKLNRLKDYPQVKLIAESLAGSRGEDQELIARAGLEWITTLLKKNSDYGSSVFTPPVLAPGMETVAAIDVRMSDKIARIQNLKKKSGTTHGPEITSETIQDTYDDLGSYCLLRKIACQKNNEKKT